jgi:hypothetical protein
MSDTFSKSDIISGVELARRWHNTVYMPICLEAELEAGFSCADYGAFKRFHEGYCLCRSGDAASELRPISRRAVMATVNSYGSLLLCVGNSRKECQWPKYRRL